MDTPGNDEVTTNNSNSLSGPNEIIDRLNNYKINTYTILSGLRTFGSDLKPTVNLGNKILLTIDRVFYWFLI